MTADSNTPMHPDDPRHLYPMTESEASAAWPCGTCGIRRDEHADQVAAPLAITDHTFTATSNRYRVTTVAYVDADSEEEALEREARGEGHYDLEEHTAELVVVPAGDRPGCPACGSRSITVTATAIGNATVTWPEDDPHPDNVEWSELTDVDVGEAMSFTCDACQEHRTVNGDAELYYVLGLGPTDAEMARMILDAEPDESTFLGRIATLIEEAKSDTDQ